MEILFYQTLSPKNKLDKELTFITAIEGNLKDSVQLTNCTIEIFSAETIKDIINYNNVNYCYIPQFMRYYFIDDITINTNDTFIIYLTIDVLMTYNENIKNMTVKVSESNIPNENKCDLDMTDTKNSISRITIENPFSESGNLYMACAGGITNTGA